MHCSYKGVRPVLFKCQVVIKYQAVVKWWGYSRHRHQDTLKTAFRGDLSQARVLEVSCKYKLEPVRTQICKLSISRAVLRVRTASVICCLRQHLCHGLHQWSCLWCCVVACGVVWCVVVWCVAWVGAGIVTEARTRESRVLGVLRTQARVVKVSSHS